MKIIELTAENVKRLRAVHIEPAPGDGMVVIGGRNGQGKTSVLDSIMYAMGGAETLPEVPIRQGETGAKVVVKLDNLTVERRWTAGGQSYLSVTAPDGAKYPSPQAMLDKLTGSLTFDPLAFTRQTPKQQAETLRSLVGVDTTAIDAERAEAFQKRTMVGRQHASAKAQLDMMPLLAGVPEHEADLKVIAGEIAEAEQHNADARKAQSRIADAKAVAERAASELKAVAELQQTKIDAAKDRVHRLRIELEEAISAQAQIETKTGQILASKKIEMDEAFERMTSIADATPPDNEIDLNQLRAKLAAAGDLNRKYQQAQARKTKATEVDALAAEQASLTRAVEAADEAKRALIAGAKYPIEGLSITTEGVVTFQGLPISQASSAEQLKVSVAMGLAMNPKVRVMLVRDGSLLDEQSMAVLGQLASAADAQVWVERVGTGAEVSVVIEDGEIAPTAASV